MKENDVIWYEIKQQLSLFIAHNKLLQVQCKKCLREKWIISDLIAKEGISFRQP